MAFPWAAVGGIASAVSGLFGGDDDEQTQTTTSTVNYKQMVKSAQKAGFNPLTALRNGGSAGFATTTTTMPALSSQSTAGRIAGAVGAIADGMSNQQAYTQAAERAELENEMIRQQIRTLQTPVTGPIGGGLSTRSLPKQGAGTGYPGRGQPGTTGGNLEPSWKDTLAPDGTVLRGPNMDNQGDAETELWWLAKQHLLIDEVYRLGDDNLQNSTQWRRLKDTVFGPGNDWPSESFKFDPDAPNTIPGYWNDFKTWWEGGSTLPANPLQQPRDPLPGFHKGNRVYTVPTY